MRRVFLGCILALATMGMGQSCTPGGGVTCTANLNLWLPPANYPNWNVPLNANFSTIDTASASWAKWSTGTGAPTATCSAVMNNGAFYTSNTLVLYQCSNVTGTYQWNKLGVQLPSNAFGNLSNDGSGDLAWVPPFAVDITKPPYNAHCDGTTDDSAAIQSALDNNIAIVIPGSSNLPTQCDIGTEGITLCNGTSPDGVYTNIVYGNGGILIYDGTGTAITSTTCFYDAFIQNLNISVTSTASPVFRLKNTTLLNVTSGGEVPGAVSLDLVDNDYIAGYSGFAGSIETTGSPDALVIINTTAQQGATLGGTGVLIGGDYAGITLESNSNWTLITPDLSPLSSGYSLALNGGTVNGSILTDSLGPGGVIPVSGTAKGGVLTWEVFDTNFGTLNFNPVTTPLLYSVAGTPLPTCNSGSNGTTAIVSDATTPTFLGTYTGSGAVRAPVLCNGTNWVTY